MIKIGNVTATAQVVSSSYKQTILAIFRKHTMGDWGDLCHENRMFMKIGNDEYIEIVDFESIG